MKARLEAIANASVIMVALIIAYRMLIGNVGLPVIRRSVAPGDRLPRVSGIDWSRHERTLVLVLNSGCRYCEESAPFYRTLMREQRGRGPARDGLAIIAVFPNGADAVKRFLRNDQLALQSIAGVPLAAWGVVATPTILLVDSNGRVDRSWLGVLTPQQESDVFKEAFGLP
jgi:hypothetical protein